MDIKKPEWLKSTYNKEAVEKMNVLLEGLSLNTVCREANCPNMGECFKKNTATFMIMGENCTRNCKYCAVTNGKLLPLDPEEPANVAKASKKLGLKHIVVTSVTRDDLDDGGANHFAETIRAIKNALPESTVEVLIPDMKGIKDNLDIVIKAKPDVINHNIETVPSHYYIRPGADFYRSISVLKYVKEKSPETITKTGIMLGLGETEEEVINVIDKLVEIDCDIFTLGQYLRPSENHVEVKEYVTPEKFDEYKSIGLEKGLKFVASAPLVRSSYNAIDAIQKIRGAHGL